MSGLGWIESPRITELKSLAFFCTRLTNVAEGSKDVKKQT